MSNDKPPTPLDLDAYEGHTPGPWTKPHLVEVAANKLLTRRAVADFALAIRAPALLSLAREQSKTIANERRWKDRHHKEVHAMHEALGLRGHVHPEFALATITALRAELEAWKALGNTIDHNILHEEHHWYDDLAALLSQGEGE